MQMLRRVIVTAMALAAFVAVVGCASVASTSSTDSATSSADTRIDASSPAAVRTPVDLIESEAAPPTQVEAIASEAAAPSQEVTTASPAAPVPTATPAPVEFGTPLPRAPTGTDALAADPVGKQPVSIVIDDLDIADAPVVPVGINPDDTLEVPAADEVGWYRFGPRPGIEGSSVLAAHIAYDGVDGVFRSLSEVEVGAEVMVGFDDGSSERFRIVSVTDYFKEELPDSLFAREGDSQLVLITCGGGFNPDLRSYDSNTVAIAIPA